MSFKATGFHGGRVSPHVDNALEDEHVDIEPAQREPPGYDHQDSLDVEALVNEVEQDEIEPFRQDPNGEVMDPKHQTGSFGSLGQNGEGPAENGNGHHHDGSPRHKGGDETGKEYMKMRDAIEQIMAGKIIQRREAESRFGWDMIQACIYSAFLVILTVSVLQQDTSLMFHAKSNMLSALGHSTSFGVPASDLTVGSVGTVSDIYDFLKLVVLPVTSEYNMTVLDPLCTEDGGHKLGADACTTSESNCCFSRQPNYGPFSGSGNFLMTPVTVRQLRVRRKESTTSFGFPVSESPEFSPDWEEVRDGGGTLPDHDPSGLETDWPSDRPWYKYTRCSATWKDQCYLDDSNAFYDSKYTKTGYVASLTGTTDQMILQVDDLQKYSFIDRIRSRAVFIEFTGYFVASQLFCSATVLFEMTEVGGMHQTVRIRVNSLNQKKSFGWEIVDWIVFGYALGIVMMMDLYQLFRKGWQYFFIDSGWKVISWINYGLFIWSLVVRIQNNNIYNDLSEMEPLGAKAMAFPWTEMMYWEDTYSFVNGYNVLLSWIRLLRYIEAISPGTRQLTETIAESSNQLSTLLVLFMIVYTGYAIGYTLAFGGQVWDYADVRRSYLSLFEIILGEFDYYELHQVDKFMAPWMFVTFVVVMFFILLNMILAVVMQTYDHVQHQLSGLSKTEVTGASLLRQQSKEFLRLLTAKTLDELRHPPKRKIEVSIMAIEELDVFKREFLEEPQFKDLFSDDHDALERLNLAFSFKQIHFLSAPYFISIRMGVRNFDELMRYADISGDPRLPMAEVWEFREKLKMQEEKYQKLHEEEEVKVLDAEQVKAIVDSTVNAATQEITQKLENFIQAQLAQATLFLSGVQMPQAQGGGGEGGRGLDESQGSPSGEYPRQNAALGY